MISKDDILSMEFLKKSEYTGCHQGMRYRLEQVSVEDEKMLKATVWPEPLNFIMTPEEEKRSNTFSFSQDGVTDAVDWMNNVYFEERERFVKN
ncbi:MAG: hypothetical protein IJ282_00735 [Lachnospiraceae bacterium]|nr:hypothetical protein [Lachnospiraceae bacterium]